MSDQEYGKKLVEEIELEPFLKEYEWVTGFSLQLVGRTERPDFIVQRSDGIQLGIELTKVMRDPESTFWASYSPFSVELRRWRPRMSSDSWPLVACAP